MFCIFPTIFLPRVFKLEATEKGLRHFSFSDVFRTFRNLGACLPFRKFTHGKYLLRRRDNLPDYELFQADFDSDIDSEVGDSGDICVEISDEAFPDESNVDFVNETVAVRDVVENRDNVAISTPSREKQNNNPIPDVLDNRNWTDGDKDLSLFPQFIENSSILVDVPDDADELCFFSLFIH